MIICFWFQIILSCSCCCNCDISMFSHIFYGFFKKYIIHQLDKYFLKSVFAFFLSCVFALMYGFMQASWFNLIALCTSCISNPSCNVWFKFLLLITYSLLSWQLATSNSTFRFSSFRVKIVNNYGFYAIFMDIEYQLQ